MKLKFKVQPYQSLAVASVVDCFAGQPRIEGTNYRIDPGVVKPNPAQQLGLGIDDMDGFRNAELKLTAQQLLVNIQEVQRRQNLPLSQELITTPASRINLDVEMETGTGKTYCYLKTVFEMNQRYGWSKFIIVVPSIAIREGVYKSLEITADHFTETYRKKIRFFIYNSKQLHQLESFSSDAGINLMVINIQAFNASGKDNRRIYEELDDFQSRRPIDVISRNRPILILDEPQKMEGKKTLDGLQKFEPLMILRYSATHKTRHNRIHRLDALDAYNQKLVKKIAVRGISVRGLAGTTAYLYLEGIDISRQAPVARLQFEIRQANGIKRVTRKVKFGDNLFDLSNHLDQYQGFVISQIDANQDKVEFANGVELLAGEATGDVTEAMVRRLQIRETIKAHLEKEKQLFAQNIKVLSLFFIDEVAKYRDYSAVDDNGEYACIFEEEYQSLRNEYLSELALENTAYRTYLQRDAARKVHNGYFSIDKKSKRMTDPSMAARGESAGLSDDVDAYDLILKDKERLLGFDEPTRFIFSHSALREGWDNPNVFVMCMLKHSDNTVSRRQEVGRGLRLAVNKHGDRQDNPATVHQINVLDVVTSESYTDFVTNLQREMSEAVSDRPRVADVAYFTGKVVNVEFGQYTLTESDAKKLEFYLIQNGYVDEDRHITAKYHDDLAKGDLAPVPAALQPIAEPMIALINSVFSEAQLPMPENGRGNKTNPLNDNIKKKEFLKLWSRINRKAVYQVDFDSTELVRHAVRVINTELSVSPLQYTLQAGVQDNQLTVDQLRQGRAFGVTETKVETEKLSVHSAVRYDLVGKIAENTQLTRRTIGAILAGIEKIRFEQFRLNPEQFIAEASRLISEQKASVVVEKLSYDETNEEHVLDEIFTTGENQNFSQAIGVLNKHVYDYVITDSGVEKKFVERLDSSADVVVYAKLPRGFYIPTPVGNYNPDWAISFKEGSVKHIYFVAETKGSLSSLQLKGMEEQKIACARKFFEKLGAAQAGAERVTYNVVDSFERLMDLVAS